MPAAESADGARLPAAAVNARAAATRRPGRRPDLFAMFVGVLVVGAIAAQFALIVWLFTP